MASYKENIHDVEQVKFLEIEDCLYYITNKKTIIKKRITNARTNDMKMHNEELTKEDLEMLKDYDCEELWFKYIRKFELERGKRSERSVIPNGTIRPSNQSIRGNQR